jgi:hypothetical protein
MFVKNKESKVRMLGQFERGDSSVVDDVDDTSHF